MQGDRENFAPIAKNSFKEQDSEEDKDEQSKVSSPALYYYQKTTLKEHFEYKQRIFCEFSVQKTEQCSMIVITLDLFQEGQEKTVNNKKYYKTENIKANNQGMSDTNLIVQQLAEQVQKLQRENQQMAEQMTLIKSKLSQQSQNNDMGSRQSVGSQPSLGNMSYQSIDMLSKGSVPAFSYNRDKNKQKHDRRLSAQNNNDNYQSFAIKSKNSSDSNSAHGSSDQKNTPNRSSYQINNKNNQFYYNTSQNSGLNVADKEFQIMRQQTGAYQTSSDKVNPHHRTQSLKNVSNARPESSLGRPKKKQIRAHDSHRKPNGSLQSKPMRPGHSGDHVGSMDSFQSMSNQPQVELNTGQNQLVGSLNQEVILQRAKRQIEKRQRNQSNEDRMRHSQQSAAVQSQRQLDQNNGNIKHNNYISVMEQRGSSGSGRSKAQALNYKPTNPSPTYVIPVEIDIIEEEDNVTLSDTVTPRQIQRDQGGQEQFRSLVGRSLKSIQEEASFRENSPLYDMSQRSREQGRNDNNVGKDRGFVKASEMHYGAPVNAPVTSLSSIINNKAQNVSTYSNNQKRSIKSNKKPQIQIKPKPRQPVHQSEKKPDSLPLQSMYSQQSENQGSRASEASNTSTSSFLGSFFKSALSLIMSPKPSPTRQEASGQQTQKVLAKTNFDSLGPADISYNTQQQNQVLPRSLTRKLSFPGEGVKPIRRSGSKSSLTHSESVQSVGNRRGGSQAAESSRRERRRSRSKQSAKKQPILLKEASIRKNSNQIQEEEKKQTSQQEQQIEGKNNQQTTFLRGTFNPFSM